MEEHLHRVEGLIIDVEIKISTPPDDHPALIDNECNEILLFKQWPQFFGESHNISSGNFTNYGNLYGMESFLDFLLFSVWTLEF